MFCYNQSMAREKEKPPVPSFSIISLNVSPDERVQLDSISHAIAEKLMHGKLVTNWCPKCGKWRFQFVSQERMKSVLSNETFLCTKCSTPIKLILDNLHVLVAS